MEGDRFFHHFLQNLQKKERDETEEKLRLENEQTALLTRLIELGAGTYVNDHHSTSPSPKPSPSSSSAAAAAAAASTLGSFTQQNLSPKHQAPTTGTCM